MASEKNYKLYGFAPYQLTGIQAGIQFGHAVARLAFKYKRSPYASSEPDDTFYGIVRTWAEEDETFVVLNGGSLSDIEPLFNEFFSTFNGAYPYATFFEPDLCDAMSSFVFLVPESDWGFYESEKWKNFQSAPKLAGWTIDSPMVTVPPMRLFLDRFKLHGG